MRTEINFILFNGNIILELLHPYVSYFRAYFLICLATLKSLEIHPFLVSFLKTSQPHAQALINTILMFQTVKLFIPSTQFILIVNCVRIQQQQKNLYQT